MENIGFGSNRIVISTPACEQPASVEWGVNLAGMRWPLNASVEYSSQDGCGEDIDVLRNYVAGYALATKARYIWFLGSNILPPSWASTQLIEAMRADPTIMVCAGVSEAYDSQGDILLIPDEQYVSLECTMVRTEIFDKIEEPWFKESGQLTSEAIFCQKVVNAGYKITAHSGVLCGYVDMETGKPEWPIEAVDQLNLQNENSYNY